MPELRQLLEHRGLHRRAARHVVPGERGELRLEHAAHALHFFGQRRIRAAATWRCDAAHRGAPCGAPNCATSGDSCDDARLTALGEVHGCATGSAVGRRARTAAPRARLARMRLRRWRAATSKSMAATTSTSSPTLAATTGSPHRAQLLAHLRSAVRMSLAMISLNLHHRRYLSTTDRRHQPDLAVVGNLVPGQHVQARARSTRKNRASAARSVGGTSSTAGSPPRSWRCAASCETLVAGALPARARDPGLRAAIRESVCSSCSRSGSSVMTGSSSARPAMSCTIWRPSATRTCASAAAVGSCARTGLLGQRLDDGAHVADRHALGQQALQHAHDRRPAAAPSAPGPRPASARSWRARSAAAALLRGRAARARASDHDG